MLSHVLTVHVFSLWKEEQVSPDTCAAVVATHSADVPALVMRVRLQLLLSRGATWPSSLNTQMK